MTLDELYETIDGVELEGIDINLELQSVLIRHKPTGLCTNVTARALDAIDWPTLHSLLKGEREGRVLKHMTRVVGYYSQTANWNPSKLGELKDRHKGNYTVPNP